MKLQKLTPVIYTDNLQETVDFYMQLGFTCLANEPEWGWARVQLDDVDLMISRPNMHLHFDKPVFTGSFYITTDDADTMWKKMNGKAKVCYPIENFEYGMREFAIYDNNGYLLQFGQAITKNE